MSRRSREKSNHESNEQRDPEDWRRVSITSALCLAAALSALSALRAVRAVRAQPQQGNAKSILKATADYVSGQETIELTFDSDIEIITPQMEKIQFANSGEVLLNPPDKLRAHRVGGYADVTLFFDGKTASIYGKNLNAYAQFDAAGNVDQLIEALRSGHGVALPGADFLLSRPYDVLVADVMEAKHIGRGVMEGSHAQGRAVAGEDFALA